MPVKVFLYKTPGLSVASSGERITRDIDFYKKVGEVEHCFVCLLRYKKYQLLVIIGPDLNMISPGDSILHVELNLTFNTANPSDSLQSTATILST